MDEILVLGATGTTGKRVVRELQARGLAVRAASRRGRVRFDWGERDTWGPALAGAGAVYLMAPHELPVDPEFVHEAVAHGVRRIVLLSSRGIEEMGDERLLGAEALVRESGVEWTVVRADWFNQNFDEGFFRPAIEAGALAVPVGDIRQGFVDADDIAAVAAVALTEDGHAGRTYEVTGPRALSFGEALALISDASGRPIRFGGTPDEYRAQQDAIGMPRERTEAEIEAFAQLKDGEATDDVPNVTGRAAVDFATYATRAWAT
ncbi:NAD(P)H-binding protein [Saccharothrix sp.]|uniref:NmrA family NAD(P)-binding protein n=1 Tax=Saccharothrix sp. TaxID=1873460 RepID=UPI00281191A6|nr:NAD(P)H-binding protein [Saccharothrix sp.]